MIFYFEEQKLDFMHHHGYVLNVCGVEINDQLDIFVAFGKGLDAPNGYFGENWNAFRDCLLDLQWIEETDIFIIHHGLPHLSHRDMAIYLDILHDVSAIWEDESTDNINRLYPEFIPHRLKIYFPSDVESLVQSYVGCNKKL